MDELPGTKKQELLRMRPFTALSILVLKATIQSLAVRCGATVSISGKPEGPGSFAGTLIGSYCCKEPYTHALHGPSVPHLDGSLSLMLIVLHLNEIPEGPSTRYLRILVPNTIKGMVFGTRDLKSWVLGASGQQTLFFLGCLPEVAHEAAVQVIEEARHRCDDLLLHLCVSLSCQTMVCDIALVLGLRNRPWDPYVCVAFGAPPFLLGSHLLT